MNDYVTDTVALILRLEKRVLSSTAHQAFLAVEQGKANLYIPAMVLAEIMYLSERKRIVATLTNVQAYLQQYSTCRECHSPLQSSDKPMLSPIFQNCMIV